MLLSLMNTEIDDLRQSLKQLNAWPEAGDQFLALMPQSRWNAPQVGPDDRELLPVVAQKAVNGADIGARYPAFFQKLLAHAELRQDFLVELSRSANGNHSPNGNHSS